MKRNSLRIAVAEDEPLMRMYLEDIIPDFGHEIVASAKDGAELVAECLKHRPDLIITDVRMPRMDGIEALRQIMRDQALPAVVVSAFYEAEELDDIEENAVLVHLTKPVGQEEIRSAIETAVKRFSESQTSRAAQSA
jgi:response regulator NasT